MTFGLHFILSGQPSQLAVLASLEKPRSVKELADANGLPYQGVYKAVQELAERGVVTSHREGKELVVEAAAPAVPGLARTLLLDQRREDWGRIFHGDRPIVLHVLDRTGDPNLTAEVCGKTPRAIYYTISDLGPAGVLVRPGGRYQINPILRALKALAGELANLESLRCLRAVDPNARLLWSLGPEVLFRSDEDLDQPGVHLAAPSAFAGYDVPLITMRGDYYYLSQRSLDVADAILQGFLADPENKINRSYCALVYEKHRPKDLVKRARIYGLEREAKALIRYVDEHDAGDVFLPWHAHQRYRRQYGVGA